MSRSHSRSELGFLLQLLGSEISPRAAGKRMAVLDATFGWDRFVRLARAHGVVPLMWKALRDAEVSVPEAVREVVQQETEHNARAALQQTAHLISLVRGLDDEGIPSLVLKGPPLALAAYGDLGLRRAGDIDLLVSAGTVEATIDFLVDHGYQLVLRTTGEGPECAAYRQVVADIRLGRTQLAGTAPTARDRGRAEVPWARPNTPWQAFKQLGNELAFVGENGVVDLHWKPFRNAHLFPLDLWDSAVTVTINGVDIKVPGPEVELAYLCAHGAMHEWEELRWLVDVPLLVRRVEIDFDLVHRVVRGAGLERIVTSAFLIAAERFDTPVPLLFATRSRSDRGVARLVAASTASLDPGEANVPGALGNLRYYLTLRRDVSYRGRAFEDVLAPANWWLETTGGPVRRAARILRCVTHTFVQEHRSSRAARRQVPSLARDEDGSAARR